MKFTKMQGAGNDFVILDNRDGHIPGEQYSALAKKLCERRLSIGADGLMIVVKAERGGDYGMRFYNSDGTRGEMCGNGARCIARYGFENGLAGAVQHIETTAGMVIGKRITDSRYRIRLNDPSVVKDIICLSVDGCEYICSYVELGNPGIPHALVRLDDWDTMDRKALFALGRALRRDSIFPKGANVTFRKKLSDGHYSCITFERGVEDFTLACGTGAGSTAAAMAALGENDIYPVVLDFPGGTLELELTKDADGIHDLCLTGPTVVVAQGDYIGE